MRCPNFLRMRNTRVVFRGKQASPEVLQEIVTKELQRELCEVRQDMAFLLNYPTQAEVEARIGRLSKAVALGAEILGPADPFTSDSPGEELLKLLAHAKKRGYIKED